MGTTYKTRHSLVNLIFSSSHACHHLSSTFLNLKAFSTIGNRILVLNLLKMTRIRQDDPILGTYLHYDPLRMSQKEAPRKHPCVLSRKVAKVVLISIQFRFEENDGCFLFNQ